jgi:hypothetical protein
MELRPSGKRVRKNEKIEEIVSVAFCILGILYTNKSVMFECRSCDHELLNFWGEDHSSLSNFKP